MNGWNEPQANPLREIEHKGGGKSMNGEKDLTQTQTYGTNMHNQQSLYEADLIMCTSTDIYILHTFVYSIL